MRVRFGHIVSLLGILLLAAPAAAQQPKEIGGSGSWKAYTFQKGSTTVCYMASAPIKQEGNYTRRDPAFVLVTNDPTRGSFGEVSVVTGYTYKKDKPVSVRVDSQRFSMFTQDDKAWTEGPNVDSKLVRSMIRGSKMTISGTSSRGTETKDTYSLSGFTKTKKVIDKTCPK